MKFEIRPSHPAFPDGRPLAVGRSFLIVPDGTGAVSSDRIAILLTRGEAFGSGLHETTISCIEEMEKLPSVGDSRVLDFGTGTGILSLAALKLGARRAVAVDTDIDAVRTCRRNAVTNGLAEKLMIYRGSVDALSPANGFGLILANVYGDILLREAPGLASRVRAGGYMILSGLEYTDSGPLKNRLTGEGMEEISVIFLEDYVTQVWRHPPERAEEGP
ncbi:MAG: 50S ribosomal protein L11 methyltransferase [Pseudomonadota bacterium]|jgi:ribosomal protein L11 methyltransferase